MVDRALMAVSRMWLTCRLLMAKVSAVYGSSQCHPDPHLRRFVDKKAVFQTPTPFFSQRSLCTGGVFLPQLADELSCPLMLGGSAPQTHVDSVNQKIIFLGDDYRKALQTLEQQLPAYR